MEKTTSKNQSMPSPNILRPVALLLLIPAKLPSSSQRRCGGGQPEALGTWDQSQVTSVQQHLHKKP